MNSKHLLQDIVRKLLGHKILIIIAGVILAALFFLKAKTTKPEYTSKATVFPLSNPSDNAISTSTLSALLGESDATKNFSSEASLNIIELALSRNVRECVAVQRVPEYKNKTVSELLVQEYNDNHSFFSKKVEWPADSISQAVIGGKILMPEIAAKINKNGVLEVNYTNTDTALVRLISNILISQISQFYITLRTEKATEDYNFVVNKIDSLNAIIAQFDTKQIQMDNTTLFTPGGKLQYEIPKENLNDAKLMVSRERDANINNREDALWRLQKATPIVATLDKPNPPYDMSKPSSIVYAIIGFIVGCLLMAFILIVKPLYTFVKAEVHKAVFSEETPVVPNTAS